MGPKDPGREAFLREAERLYQEMVAGAGPASGESFDDMEERAEAAGLQLRRKLLALRLAAEEAKLPAVISCPQCRRPMRWQKTPAPRDLDTFSGPVPYERRFVVCDPCGISFSPLDRRLGIPDRGASARLVKKACDANRAGSFEKGAVLFESFTGLRITAKKIQLLTERVGEILARQRDASTASFLALESHPEPPKAPLPLLVVTADGGRVQTLGDSPDERWKEDKIGVVYDATPKPEVPGIEYEGPHPIARSIVATMGSWEQLGDHLSALADRRGYTKALAKLFISDGATHLRSLRERCFPDAQFILDWTHATEHVHQDAIAGFGPGPQAEAWAEAQKNRLWTGRLDRFFANLQTLGEHRGPPPKKAAPSDPRRILATDLAYFRTNQAGLDYPTFRKNGWPTGSSIIESTVKQTGKRVKGSEKFWSLPGAEQTLQVVSHLNSDDGSWNRFWDSHPLTSAP